MMLGGLFKRLFPTRDDAEQLARTRLDAWHAWLLPLAGDTGVGRDPGYEDTFFALREETQKLSGIDDGLIVSGCEQLLKETGKDLRLAGYYAFARLRQDGPSGFADGLELAAALVDRYGETVLPARAEAKRGALEMLATTRMIEMLESRGAFAPADLERALAALDVLVACTQTWSDAARPNLQALISRFERNNEPALTAEQGAAVPSPLSAATAAFGTITSARDLLDQARTMAVWLRDQENGYLPSVRLVRSVRWDTLHEVPPADAASHTRLVAPRGELRQQMKRLVLQKQWHELLERVEGAFMEGVNHLWFDLQYFQHVALDHIGAPYSGWRALLRADFALFLERLPGIERLAFADGTPFADDATLEWIARHAVVRDLEAGESVAPLPVSAESVGDAAGDWPEIEAQARELAGREGVEAAFAWLEALPGMKTDRHRYLQRLVMARLADQASRPDTALALLAELDASSRTLPLTRWEPALVFEVKQQLVRALKAMSNRKDADKPALARRIGELQAELTVLDPARALTLS
ncbi:type VI secretion system protein TssA [Burkholderia glumae]|uniref:type VI secretion system protein TssA n=1 Tax=Burkholderia glumae TaxID=337 RepID=UPI00039BF803|nr:type VI secretion system protein TssA [Burkholderia glumae]MCM2495702.1 type VI secretion system protein TssA [Burkholderia glumae]MCM2546712.1 type VI secretion system protein TssA [Burkholderia glumae]MCM2552372.1 type VI secretion system protein TssA [Burkholderia glumae]NVE24645.1 type VI secretion system protein TssA [Burkholderia glumae]QGA40735.1 type VI secretion system protein TssA [Burkholderia glumae]